MAEANSKRQRAAMDFLERLADLGVAQNRDELLNMYRYVDNRDANANLVDLGTLAKRYNKLNGTNYTSNDFDDLLDEVWDSTFGVSHFELPKYSRLSNEATSDGTSYYDLVNTYAPYYKEDASGTPVVTPSTSSAREILLNEYYRDAYDNTTPGTSANRIYNQLVENNQTAAVEAARIADLNAQQAAMQQAATVKQITDQVRNERMARLRAGMSEAQIANQDMQSLMTNINALNQQANEANLARLSAQSAYNTAQADAYNAWLQQANAMGTVGTGSSAADAGDSINVANRLGYYSEKDKKFKTNFSTTTGTGK